MSEELIVRKEDISDYYDIGEQIGSGQFAVVKKMQEKSTGDTFAAKFMKKKRSKALKKGMTEEQFLREADVLRSVDHKGVICLHEIFETQVEYVLILELLSGGELFEFLSEQEFLTEDEAVGFLKQVIEAIEYLHSKSIVHLDIKPENIVLKEEGSFQIKLIDFGLARKLCKGEMIREIMGTPEFVAPEIIAFEAVGAETDMWAIGVLTYIMLSGASPFLGDDVNETFSNISMVDYEFDEEYFKDISLPAKDFISNLLVKDTCDRLTARDCLDHDWMQEFEDQSSEDGDDASDTLITSQAPIRKGELKKRRSTMIKTDAFKAFTARARWQKSLSKVIAISRLALLGKKNGPLQRNSSDVENDNIKPSLNIQTSTNDKDSNEERIEEKSMKIDIETVTEKRKETCEISKEQLPEKEISLEELGKENVRRRQNIDEEIDSENKNEILELHRNGNFENSTTVEKNENGKCFQENQVEVGDFTIEGKGSKKQELPVNEQDKPVKPVHPVSSSALEIRESESPLSTQRNSQARLNEDTHHDRSDKLSSDKIETNKPQKKTNKDAKKEASLNKDRLNRFEKLKSKFLRSSTEDDQNTHKPRRKISAESLKHKETELPESLNRTRRKSDQLSLRVNWERLIAKSNETQQKGYNALETTQRLNKPPSNERLRSRSQPVDMHSTEGTHAPNSDEVDKAREESPRKTSAPLANEGIRAKRLDDSVWLRRPSSSRPVEERKENKNIQRTLTSTKAEVLKWEQRSSGKMPPNRSFASRPLKENAGTGEQRRLSPKTTHTSNTIEVGESKKKSIGKDEIPVISIDKRHTLNKTSSPDDEASSIQTSLARVQGVTNGEHEDDESTAVIDTEHMFVIQTLKSEDSSKTKVEPDSVKHKVISSRTQMGRKVGMVQMPVVENPTRVEVEDSSRKEAPRKSREQRKVQTVVKHELNPDETDFPQYALTLQKVTATDDGDEKDDFVWVMTTEKNKRRDFLSKVLSSKMNTAKSKDQASAPVDIFEKRRIRHKPLSEKGPPNLKFRTKSTPQEPVISKSEIKIKHHSVASGPTTNVAHIQLTSDMPAINFKIQLGEIKLADP